MYPSMKTVATFGTCSEGNHCVVSRCFPRPSLSQSSPARQGAFHPSFTPCATGTVPGGERVAAFGTRPRLTAAPVSRAACVDSASGVRVCHMQEERSRRIMAEVQVYASVEQVPPSPRRLNLLPSVLWARTLGPGQGMYCIRRVSASAGNGQDRSHPCYTLILAPP